jgi:hypothetical protein
VTRETGWFVAKQTALDWLHSECQKAFSLLLGYELTPGDRHYHDGKAFVWDGYDWVVDADFLTR